MIREKCAGTAFIDFFVCSQLFFSLKNGNPQENNTHIWRGGFVTFERNESAGN